MADDLTTSESVLAFLEHLTSCQFHGTTATRISGGFANYVWRVELVKPHRGHPTIILKHAKAFASGNSSIALSVDRMEFEEDALAIFGARLTSSTSASHSAVRVPEVFHRDAEKHVMIMEDAGDIPSLKAFVSQTPPSTLRTKVVGEIGNHLGSFLAFLHSSGGDEDVKAKFLKNDASRKLCAWRDAGRLSASATRYAAADPRYNDIATRVVEDTLKSDETFNMGDFWTGNVLVSTNFDGTLESLWVVDWELAKYGPAAADLGQFGAEAWGLARFRDRNAGNNLLSSFRASYLTAAAHAGLAKVSSAEVAVHLATHVVVWTPLVGWGDENVVKKAEEDTIPHLLSAWDAWQEGKEAEWYTAP